MSELIQDNEVNIDRLESIFKSEYYNTLFLQGTLRVGCALRDRREQIILSSFMVS